MSKIILLIILLNPSLAFALNSGYIGYTSATNCGPNGDSPCIINSPIYTNGTNTGFNNNNPQYTIDVNGNVNANNYYGNGSHLTGITVSAGGVTNQFQINNLGSFGGGNIYQDINSNVGISTVSPTQEFQIGSGLFNVNSSGNVGIGSLSPGQLLDVHGTIRAISVVSTGIGNNGDYQYNNNGSLNANNTLYTDGTNVFSTTLQGNVEINGITGTLSVPGSISSTGPIGAIQFPQVPTPASNPPSGYDYLYVKNNDKLYSLNSSGSETAVQTSQWTGTNPIYVAGISVGIGSITPGQALDVQGTVRTTGFQLSTGASSGYTLISNSVGIGTWQPAPSSMVYPGAGVANSTGSAWGTSYTTTGNGTVLALQAQPNFTANVGIGSITPGQALDVNGTVRATGLTAGASGITLGGVTNTSWPGGANYWSLNGGAGNVGVSTTNTVGIGTTSAGAGAGLVVMNGNVGIGTWVPGGALIVQGGNVGIGTANPTASLQVTGSGVLTVTNQVGVGTANPTGAMEIEGGNVGIGTPTPSDKLHVNGSILFNGNLAGGVTGNVGIGTTVVTTTTCDSSCNTANKRCLFGLTIPLTGLEPCSATITGDCVCLPAS